MPPADRPNVLFIFTDQHRLSAVGAYGETPCRTPNIDRLAERGVRFETAYTVFPVCSPARGTIMTGLYPHAHGVCSNVGNLGCSVHDLPDHPRLLSRRLERAGYRCGYTGKWHLGTDGPDKYLLHQGPSLPKHVGFEGQNFPGHGGHASNFPPFHEYLAKAGLEHNVTKAETGTGLSGVVEGPVECSGPYFLTDHTIGLMEHSRRADEPWFVWHNFWGPHAPYWPTREYYEMYRDVELPEWPNFRWEGKDPNGPYQAKLHNRHAGLEWSDWAETIRHYYALTTMIDAQIGRMIDYLDEAGLAENTIVIFTADHGESLGSHGGMADKGWGHFEETQRIPLIAFVPERFGAGLDAGTVLPQFASLADIYPTILDAAGAPDDFEDHGLSLMPLLRGESPGWRDEVFCEFLGVNSFCTSTFTVRRGNMKFGWNCSNYDELYDLAVDPWEMHNLVDDPDRRSEAGELCRSIQRWLQATGYPQPGIHANACRRDYPTG